MVDRLVYGDKIVTNDFVNQKVLDENKDNQRNFK
jgi:hypothetical protein